MKYATCLLGFFFMIAGALPTLANNTRSAQYYLNTPEQFEGKMIVLYTAFVKRTVAAHRAEKVIFSAYTMSRDGNDTSYIDVIVPKDKADQFARKYGTDFTYVGGKIRKMAMPGVLRQHNDFWFLEFGAK